MEFTLIRASTKPIEEPEIRTQIQKLTDRVLKSVGRGWKRTRISIDSKEENNQFRYLVTIHFKPNQNRDSVKSKWPEIVRSVHEKTQQAGALWNLENPPEDSVKQGGKDLGEIQLDLSQPFDRIIQTHFSRIYGREPHIRLILDSLKLAKETQFHKRNHVLLGGSPGCGKTAIMEELKKILGQEGESYFWLDGTSMTKAGVCKLIMDSPVVPPVLFVEEIEKTSEDSLRFLLGLMDQRGEIRRTNYHIGHQAKDARMLVIATANDIALLQSLMSGALYSRFQNKLHCQPPDRVIMEQILKREIEDIPHDAQALAATQWVSTTLAFAYDQEALRDPRDLITILTCGRDRLLDGSYQKDWKSTRLVVN